MYIKTNFMADTNYLEMIDEVIFTAYKEGGCCILSKFVIERPVIMNLLKCYGIIDDRKFIINDKGLEYIMKGGYAGIKEDMILYRNEILTSVSTSKASVKIACGGLFLSIISIVINIVILLIG